MPDVIITNNKDIIVRAEEIRILTMNPKIVHWAITGRSVISADSYGPIQARVDRPEIVDAEFAAVTPPPGTVVELAPGVSVDISGIPALTIQAWLQWRGEALCEEAKPEIHQKIFGVPA